MIYKDEHIFVSDTTITIGDTTYPIDRITSVSTSHRPKNLAPIALSVLAALLAFWGWYSGSLAMFATAATFAVIFLIPWFMQRDRYIVQVVTQAGQTDALVSNDQAYIEQVAENVRVALGQRR